jgi:hypothetical protein
MIPLSVCAECGAVVHPDTANDHRAWHVQMRRFAGDVNELFVAVIDGLEALAAVQELDRIEARGLWEGNDQ